MPTYEYRCPAGHDFEHFFRSISTATATLPCPTCGAEAERRLSPGGGLLFKGSGFYITDYGKDGKKDQRKASDGNKSESKSSASGGDGKSTGGGGTSSSEKKSSSGSSE